MIEAAIQCTNILFSAYELIHDLPGLRQTREYDEFMYHADLVGDRIKDRTINWFHAENMWSAYMDLSVKAHTMIAASKYN